MNETEALLKLQRVTDERDQAREELESLRKWAARVPHAQTCDGKYSRPGRPLECNCYLSRIPKQTTAQPITKQ